MSHTALIIVDVQNDFCPGGALPVPDGDRVVAPLNAVIALVAAQGGPIIASRDWHPPQTAHFAPFGGAWPVHCVQDTCGAAFHAGLQLPAGAIIVSKGTALDQDAYSAFEAFDPTGATLANLLRQAGVDKLLVGGLATDYCVRATVLDALKLGFAVTVLTDCIAGVDLQPGDSQQALDEMVKAGAELAVSTGPGLAK